MGFNTESTHHQPWHMKIQRPESKGKISIRLGNDALVVLNEHESDAETFESLWPLCYIHQYERRGSIDCLRITIPSRCLIGNFAERRYERGKVVSEQSWFCANHEIKSFIGRLGHFKDSMMFEKSTLDSCASCYRHKDWIT